MRFRPLQRRTGRFQRLTADGRSFEQLQARVVEATPAADEGPAGGAGSEDRAVRRRSFDPDGDHAPAAAPDGAGPGTPGFQAGYEAGLQEGLTTSREDLDRAMGQVRELIQELELTRSRMAAESRNDLIDLALTAIEWFHLATVDSDHQLIVRIVDEALGNFRGIQPISIRLNPRDHEVLAAEMGRGQVAWSSWNLSLVADEAIQAGGCLIETDEGTVDARLEDRLARLRADLDALRADSSSAPDHGEAS